MARRSLLAKTAVKVVRRARLPNSRKLALVMQPQQEPNWCWSAVAVSISRFYDVASPWTQCSLANAELGVTTCCQDGGSAACNKEWYLDRALRTVGKLRPPVVQRAIAFNNVVAEIDGDRPVGVRVEWPGGGGHFVAIAGYVKQVDLVDVEDPLNGPSTIAYLGLRDAYRGNGKWTHTYHTARS